METASESGLSDGGSSYNKNVVKGVSEGVVKVTWEKEEKKQQRMLKYQAVILMK